MAEMVGMDPTGFFPRKRGGKPMVSPYKCWGNPHLSKGLQGRNHQTDHGGVLTFINEKYVSIGK
jgi:hypothetical protein